METLRRESRLNEVLLDGRHPYLWIVLAILLVYSRTLFFGFTGLDDKDLIVDNYNFISNLSNVPQAFMSRVFPKLPAPYYRPFLIVTFMLDSKLGGQGPFVYHATNIIIHAAVCCLLLRLLSRLGLGRLPALFFSLAFAVHPALAQAVAWIPGRNDSMLALFALASFTFFLNYLNDRRRRDYVLHLVFFTLGLFTKETAIMIIPVCLLYARMIDKKGLMGRQLRFFIWGWMATAVCWYLMREEALKGSFESTPGSLAAALFVSLPALVQYAGKILMPFNLSVFPTIQDTTFLYGVASIIIVVLALLRSKEARWRFIAFGLAWFLLFLAPSLLRPSARFVHDFQEHRIYLPVIGIIIVLSEIDLLKKMSFRKTTLAACAAALAVLAAINIFHADNFRNTRNYWEDAVRTSPGSWLTHLRLASIYYVEGDLDRAEREYLQTIKLDRVSSPAYAGLGRIYMDRGRQDMAELYLRKAAAAYNANYPVYVTLGTLYYRQGKLGPAKAMWLEALRYEPSDKDALRNLAIFCAEQKDYREARFYTDRMRAYGMEVPREFLKTIGAE